MQKDSHPIELTAPDIAPYKAGNTGIDYVTCFDSGRPGPHVMIAAVVHGHELSGAIAFVWLFRHAVKPPQGKLTVGFMDVVCYPSFDYSHSPPPPSLPRHP